MEKNKIYLVQIGNRYRYQRKTSNPRDIIGGCEPGAIRQYFELADDIEALEEKARRKVARKHGGDPYDDYWVKLLEVKIPGHAITARKTK